MKNNSNSVEGFAAVQEAGAQYARGRAGDAEEILAKLTRARPGFLPGALALADLLRWQGRRDEAESGYRRILKKDPGNARARKGLGESLAARGQECREKRRDDLAAAYFAEAARLEPSPENLERLRDCRRRAAAKAFSRGRHELALGFLLKAQDARTAGPGATRELMELFRGPVEIARAAGNWREAGRLLGELWNLPRPRAAARAYVLLVLRGWSTEASASGDEKRLVWIWLWLLDRAGAEKGAAAEAAAGLADLLARAPAEQRLRRARVLLTPFLRSPACPASFKNDFLDRVWQWSEAAQAAGELEQARGLLEWALRWEPARAPRLRGDLASILRRQADAANAAGRWPAARRKWAAAVALGADPGDGARFEQVVRLRITAARVRGRWAKAERELREAVSESPDLAALRLQLAALMIQTGRVKEADRILASVLRGARGPAGRLLRFQALAGLGRYAEAFREAELVLKTDRRAATVWLLSWPWKDWLDVAPTPGAAEAFRTRHIPALSALVARGKFLSWAHYYRGLLLRRTGAITDGAADFDAAASRPDVHPWMLFEAGLSRLYRCEFKQALAALRRTVGATEPTNWMTYAFIGECLVCLRRPKEAFASLDRAVRAAPSPDTRADALAWRGEMRLWLGRYREALSDLDEAAKAGACFAPTWRGAAKLRLGRTREALADFDAGVRVWDDIEAWIWRGEAKRLLGDARGAVRDLNRALRMSRDPWAYVNRALARADLGDAAGMKRDYALVIPELTEYARRRLGRSGAAAPDEKEMREVLEAGLAANRGFRRHLPHQTFSWMV